MAVKHVKGKHDVYLRGTYVKRCDRADDADMLFQTGRRLLMLGKPLDDVIAELRGGRDTASPRFSAYAERWLSEQGCSPESIGVYRSAIARLPESFQRMSVDAIGVAELKRLASLMNNTSYSSSTVRKSIAVAKSVLNDAADEGLTIHRPPRKLKLPRHRPVRPGFALSPEQHRAVVASSTIRTRDLFELWPWVGLRVGEMLALRRGDVDTDARLLRVGRQVREDGHTVAPPKNLRCRAVDLCNPAIPILKRILERIDGGDETLLFPSSSGGFIARRTMFTWCGETGTAAGVPGLHTHIFRHTFGSWLIDAGAPLTYVAAMMGDNIEIVLSTYAHDIEALDRRGLKAFNKWASGDTEVTDPE